jgi:hypothetical protein
MNPLLVILAIIPYGYIITVHIFYFHYSYLIGHLARPSWDDPKNLNIYYDYVNAIYYLYWFALVGFLLWIIGMIFILISRKRIELNFKMMLMFSSGYLILIYMFFIDPLGVWGWFFD